MIKQYNMIDWWYVTVANFNLNSRTFSAKNNIKCYWINIPIIFHEKKIRKTFLGIIMVKSL